VGRKKTAKSTREYLCILIPVDLFKSLDPAWKPPRYHLSAVTPSRVEIELIPPPSGEADANPL